MTRINITESVDTDSGTQWRVIGWFDPAKAQSWIEATQWDGSNKISVNTGSQWVHEQLLRTRGGRWVLNRWSNTRHGAGLYDRFRYIDDDAAREWLRLNEYAESVEEYFGAEPEESGPTPLRSIRIAAPIWDAAAFRAEAQGTTVSAVVREALQSYAAR